MRKLVVVILVLVAAGGGWGYYVTHRSAPPKAQVLTGVISRGDIVQGAASTGTLDAVRRYDIGSQVSGEVKAVYVDYNSVVKKGQLLAEIDPSLFETQVNVQQANIDRQVTDIQSQKTQLEEQKKQFERTKSLLDRGLVNQQDYEAAERDIKTAEASIVSAEKSLVSAHASLEAAELNVSYTKIIAPADGVIVERKVDVGQTVQASTTTPSFFTLSTPLDNLTLTADVDEALIGVVRPGMPVRFTVETYGQQQFLGTVGVVRLNATSTNNVVTYPVWITVPNPDLKLRPSMTANLIIVSSTAQNAVRVPNAALRFRPNAAVYAALGLTPPPEDQARRVMEAGADEDALESATVQPVINPKAHKVDEMWAPVKTPETTADVWTWDPVKKELKPIRLRLGGTDGTFTQVLSGDISVGEPIVTSVVLPATAGPNSNVNPLVNPRGAGGGYRGPGGGRGGN